MGVNVGQILRQAALAWPERIGVVDVGALGSTPRDFTFAALDEHARKVAAYLQHSGLVPGDAVALIGENSAEFVATWFGIVYAGCTVVPVPILSSAGELWFRISHASCNAVLFDAARAALVSEALADTAQRPLCASLDRIESDVVALWRFPVDTAPSDIALVLYTSGTTGKAKGAAISHASLLTHTTALVHHALALTAQDRVLGMLPLTHSYGCRMLMLATFFAGARAVLVPRFDAARTLQLLRDQEITWFPAVPTMYAAWAAQPAIAKLPALRWGLCAGAPLADAVALRAEERLGVEVRQGYGMTEATFSSINAPPDARVLGSVGKPVWGVELRIVDAAGNDVSRGQDGEIVARGSNTMSRYLHDPEATAEMHMQGFFRSGDIGRFDADGRLAIIDRIKDLIIRGGYNVYPAEVEDALAAHPDVASVAVVGRPDEYFGEEIVAVIMKREGSAPDPSAIAAFAATRLARMKVPREIAFVDALPLGESGKVHKRTLRQWLLEGRLSPTVCVLKESR